MRKIPLNLLFLLFLPALLFSEALSLSVGIDQDEIGKNEQAGITIELNQQARKIKPPQSPDFKIASGGQSRNSQVSIINGKVTQKVSFAYTFILTPKKTGTIEIPPFEVEVNKQTYYTKSLRLKINKQAVNKNKNRGGIFSPFEELFNEREKVPQIFLKLVPSLNSAYQNQQVVVDVYLITSDREAFDFEMKETAPVRSDKAFLIDLSSASNSPPARVEKNGNFYQKLYERFVLFPIEAGQVAFSPPGVIAVTPYGQLRVPGDAVAIDSRRLNNEPGISYIGSLEIDWNTPAAQVEIGKSFDITVRMKGDGNLKTLSNPYSGVKTDGLFVSSPDTQLKFLYFSNGRAVFEQEIRYTVLAQKAGSFTLPPVKIRYYDNSIKPREAVIAPFSFLVKDKKDTVAGNTYPFKNIVKPVDFKFLMFNPAILLLIVIFTLMPVLAWFYGRHKTRMENDTHYARNILADKNFSRYLTEARVSFDKGDTPAFYVALQKGLFYYLTDRLRLPQGIPFRELIKVLKERNFQPETVMGLEKLNNKCMTGAYSGRSIKTDSGAILKEAHEVFEEIRRNTMKSTFKFNRGRFI